MPFYFYRYISSLAFVLLFVMRVNCEEILDDILKIGENQDNIAYNLSEETLDESSEKSNVFADFSAPSYDKVVPLKGWTRYSGDSARTIKQWVRWWKYLAMKEPSTMTWIDGLILRIYPKNEVFRALFVRGIYDPNLVVVINSLLPRNGVFVDVGANIGCFSLLASRVIGKNGKILAIEPSSRDYARLVENVRNNNLTDLISTYRLAISDKSEIVKLSIAYEERSFLNTLRTDFSLKGIDKIGVEDVQSVSIDDLISKINVKRVDVLKLDIEGSELKALLGAKNVVERFKPAIIIGINGSFECFFSELEEIKNFLKKMNYRMYKLIENPKFALQLIHDLSIESVETLFCLHESAVIPTLPQPENDTIVDCLKKFLLK